MSQKWLIIGHYGGHNTGDEAMLCGLMSGLHATRPDIELSVITKLERLPETWHVNKVSLVQPGITAILNALWHADGVIFGGGTHFHDDYKGIRYWRHLRYLIRFIVI